MMPEGKHRNAQKASTPRIIGMIIFRILAVGAWLLAILFIIAGFQVNLLGVVFGVIVAAVLAFVGLVLWVVGDMVKDPGKIRAERLAAQAAKDSSVVIDTDNAHERQRASNGRWDGRANPGHAETAPLRPVSSELGGRMPNRRTKTTKDVSLPDDYVVLDLETTGKKYADDEIIEIGAIKVVDRIPVDKYQKLINPQRKLDPFITSLTGITDDMLENAPTLDTVLPEFLEWCGTNTLIGHNITGFDIKFLEKASRKHLHKDLTSTTIDTLQMDRTFFPEAHGHRLADLIIRYGIADTEEHRALADAEQTRRCYEWMRSYIDRNHIRIGTEQTQKNVSTTPDFDSMVLYGGVPDDNPKPKNAQPAGEFIEGFFPVAVIGEENHQDILARYGADAWIWTTLSQGEIPKGKYKGHPTIIAALDNEPVGWISAMQADRHLWRVNDDQQHYCLAFIEQGKNKLEVKLILPSKYD